MSETPQTETTETSAEDRLASIFEALHAGEYGAYTEDGVRGETASDIEFLLRCVVELHEEGTTLQRIAAAQATAIQALVRAAENGKSKPLANLLDTVLTATGLLSEGESVLPDLTQGNLEGVTQSGLVVPTGIVTPNRAERRAAAKKRG